MFDWHSNQFILHKDVYLSLSLLSCHTTLHAGRITHSKIHRNIIELLYIYLLLLKKPKKNKPKCEQKNAHHETEKKSRKMWKSDSFHETIDVFLTYTTISNTPKTSNSMAIVKYGFPLYSDGYYVSEALALSLLNILFFCFSSSFHRVRRLSVCFFFALALSLSLSHRYEIVSACLCVLKIM